MTHTTELYFEAHITIEPCFGARLERIQRIAAEYGFRVADLLMKKRQDDTPERSRYDTFCTTRHTSYDVIEARTLRCVRDLESWGFKVWRYKIEDTLLDVWLPH